MVFNYMGIYYYIFIILIELKCASNYNLVLNLKVIKENYNLIIIKLLAIKVVKTYIVLIINVGTVLVD